MSRTPIRPHTPVEVDAHSPAIAGSLRPGAGGGSDDSGVFLSPRVIDEQAFKQYAAELRSMLGDSQEAASEAKRAIEELNRSRQEAAGSAEKHKAVIEVGTKLLKAISSRTVEVERSEEKVAELVKRLDAAAARAESSATAIEAQIEDAVSGRLAEIDRLIDTRVQEMTADIERRLTERIAQLTTTLATIDVKRTELEGVIRDATDNTLVALKVAHTNAAELAGWDPADIDGGQGMGQPARDSLADLVLRAGRAQEESREAMLRLESLRTEAREAADQFALAMDHAAAEVDRLNTQQLNTASATRQALAETQRLHDQLSEQAGRAQALAGPILNAESRANTAIQQMQTIAESAQDQIMTSERAAEDLKLKVERAERSLQGLAPWADVCFASEAEAEGIELPPVLKAIVKQFRSGLSRDVTRIAEAMEQVARGTQEESDTESAGSL